MVKIKFCRWLDSNRRPVELELSYNHCPIVSFFNTKVFSIQADTNIAYIISGNPNYYNMSLTMLIFPKRDVAISASFVIPIKGTKGCRQWSNLKSINFDYLFLLNYYISLCVFWSLALAAKCGPVLLNFSSTQQLILYPMQNTKTSSKRLNKQLSNWKCYWQLLASELTWIFRGLDNVAFAGSGLQNFF